MPTYEYVCEKCGHQFDKFQPMAAKPLASCPEDLCAQKRWGKGKVRKMISAGAGLIFKGSGFYITDYRSDKYKEAAKKDSTVAGTTAPAGGDAKPAKAASGGDSKPAAKAESKPATAPKSDS
jgi:putative FmdB family regulatory protein